MNRIEKPVKGEDRTWTVTIEMGVQVSALDQYLRKYDPPLALSSNVMPADIRYGGIISMGCLTEITIVNANGELHIYSEADDAEAFNVACVNLGLLGIIYTATIKVQLMSDYHLRAIDSYEPLENFFGNEPDAGLRLKEMVMTNDSTELFYWPTARFMKHKRNEHFWLKQWRRTTDPVEDPDKYKDQLPTVDHPAFAAFKVGDIVKDLPDAIHFDVTKPGEGAGARRIFDSSAAFKVDSNFKNVVEVMNDLVDKNWAFSSSEFPKRSFTVMEWEHIPDVIPTLRREYKDRLDVFNRIRRTQDPFDMFVNDTWRPLIEERE
ncbi:hypothetical protein EC957_003342 [Mortierella hygrophila]|uniref:Uncharacterized protein n=1 Tax=Mortierella hygrophila TaxID=979708 RepID=A0A9P6K0J6_9FUNG|nr:hypothetical protein EC957_003342 [Mortierella hygrophila]